MQQLPKTLKAFTVATEAAVALLAEHLFTNMVLHGLCEAAHRDALIEGIKYQLNENKPWTFDDDDMELVPRFNLITGEI
jgi:hypothetical protein